MSRAALTSAANPVFKSISMAVPRRSESQPNVTFGRLIGSKPPDLCNRWGSHPSPSSRVSRPTDGAVGGDNSWRPSQWQKEGVMTPKLSIIVGAGALMAVSALLSGCNQSASAQNGGLQFTGSKYCAPFKTTDATGAAALNAALSDPAAAFDDCIHRWGYTLAPARDPADVVAQAAVDACGPIIAAWNQQASSQEQAAPPTRYRSRSEAQAAQQPSPQAQQIRMAESKALFYVVQARAAGCAAPPANTLLGANTNTSG
jgi:hypothetical protein